MQNATFTTSELTHDANYFRSELVDELNKAKAFDEQEVARAIQDFAGSVHYINREDGIWFAVNEIRAWAEAQLDSSIVMCERCEKWTTETDDHVHCETCQEDLYCLAYSGEY